MRYTLLIDPLFSRAGRTGRAGRAGHVDELVDDPRLACVLAARHDDGATERDGAAAAGGPRQVGESRPRAARDVEAVDARGGGRSASVDADHFVQGEAGDVVARLR